MILLKNNNWWNAVRLSSILAFVIIVPLYTYLKLIKYMDVAGVEYCMNDVYCVTQTNTMFVMLPIAELVMINYIKHDFRAAVIVRVGNMRRFWIRLVKKMAIISGILATYCYVTTTVTGLGMAVYNCNWFKDNSNAYDLLHMHTDMNVHVVYVSLIFILVEFTTILIMGMVIALFWWCWNQPIYGYVLMIVLMTLEMGVSPSAAQIFFSNVSMSIVKMILYGIDVNKQVILPFISIGIVFIIGLALIRKKDFIKGGECV